MRKVILVCGIESEDPVNLLLDSLKSRKADCLFLNQEELADRVTLRWQLTDKGVEGFIRIGDQVVSTEQIQSVFLRMMPVEFMPEFDDQPEIAGKIRSIMHSMVHLFDLLPARIVNRRRPMMSNNSKPYQALLIKKCGFSVPSTFITNDLEALKRSDLYSESMIYKSISSTRSIVQTAELFDHQRLERLRLLPTQFQEKIEGYCIRVHVIGKSAIATRINSEATDYRYAVLENKGSALSPMEINCDLHGRCVNLAERLGLNFCGIDLMVSDDRIVCLEVNPCPGYSYYQKAADQPISDVLADYLMFRNQQ
ncbi:MAG: ATP-grasp domain-containing protein [Candidatus Sabulitectum sp.]|nr:ATP-grasp domain-containing protein [Candidatus Sabulitectum sp.]